MRARMNLCGSPWEAGPTLCMRRGAPEKARYYSALVCVSALSVLVGCGGASSHQVGSSPSRTVVHIFHANIEVPGERRPSGTGFLVDEGVVATAAHVVESGEIIDVKFGDDYGTSAVYMAAKVVSVDKEKDIALLWVATGSEPLKSKVEIARLSTKSVSLGDQIAVYGFPESEIVGQELRRSSGTVSAKRKNPLGREAGMEMLEIEAKIEPGNSGSPVFDQSGEVIGLVSSRWKTTDSYALAAPISVVKSLKDMQYSRDKARAIEEIKGLPTTYIADVQAGIGMLSELRANMKGDGEGGWKRLMNCMRRGERAGKEVTRLLKRGEVISAWRHVQVLRHEVESHRHELEALRSVKKLETLIKP